VLTHRRIARGLAYSAVEYIDALRLRAMLRENFLRTHLAGADALLLPMLPEPVPTIAEATVGTPEVVETRIGNFSYWARAFNLLGLPARALPAGFTSNGVPMGVQLIGLPDSDAALCRLGERFQSASDWHRRRPPDPNAWGMNATLFRKQTAPSMRQVLEGWQ
jgi:aspartyl-tRNA(Asn)/glutamyl-tRNA(Gln) amidotransferase subunit A